MKQRFAAAAVVLVVAACGDSTGPNGNQPAPGTTEAVGGATSTEIRSVGEAETLGEFFGWDGLASGAPWNDADTEVRRQELVRDCMARHGFDYIPFQFPEGAFTVVVDEEEFIRTLGFGITTRFEGEAAFQPVTEWEDPNEKAIEAMSDQERHAYYDALYGTLEEQQDGTSVWGAGCEGHASEQVWGEENPERLMHELREEFGSQLEAMSERITADPRMIAAQQGWSACMTQAGYAFWDQQEMRQWVHDDIQKRFHDLVGDARADPFEEWTDSEIEDFFAEMTSDEIDEFWRELEVARDEVDHDGLSALQQEEIELAVTNFECNKDVNNVFEELSREYEAQFLASNRGTLERIRDSGGG